VSRKTINRIDLYEAVYRKVGLSRTETAHLVEMVLETISSAVVRGESVKISSFGTFVVREKKARIGRNPRTGKLTPITSRRVMTFKASTVLKQKVLSGAAKRIPPENLTVVSSKE